MSIARKLIPSDSAEVFPFIFKVTITTANTVFTVPLVDFGLLKPNLTISWGDGSANSPLITSSTSADRIHTYVSTGTYEISINGFMPGFSVNNNLAIRNLITELVQWGIVGVRTINFYGCQNLTTIPGNAATIRSPESALRSIPLCLPLPLIPNDELLLKLSPATGYVISIIINIT